MGMITSRATLLMIAVTLGGMGMIGEAAAWGRNVVVNGAMLDDAQLATLDNAHCMRIPDGNYFLTRSGDGNLVWGYAAWPGITQGELRENCRSGRSAQRGGTGSTGTSGSGWSAEYGRVYSGGVSAGDGTGEIYDGASGGFVYE